MNHSIRYVYYDDFPCAIQSRLGNRIRAWHIEECNRFVERLKQEYSPRIIYSMVIDDKFVGDWSVTILCFEGDEFGPDHYDFEYEEEIEDGSMVDFTKTFYIHYITIKKPCERLYQSDSYSEDYYLVSEYKKILNKEKRELAVMKARSKQDAKKIKRDHRSHEKLMEDMKKFLAEVAAMPPYSQVPF